MTLMYATELDANVFSIYIMRYYKTLNKEGRRKLSRKDTWYLKTLDIELDLLQYILNIMLSHKAT
jgi:hypothetical protein